MAINFDNKKNYLFTLFNHIIGIGLSSTISIIAIPISLKYWSVEKYGIWVILNSIINYLSFSALGINTAASILMAKNDNNDIKYLIFKKSMKMMIVSSIFTGLIFTLINLFFKNWINILGKIPDIYKKEAYITCIISGVFFIVNMPFSIISSYFYGLNKAYIEKIFLNIYAIVSFFSLLLTILQKGNLIRYSINNGIALVIVNIARLVYFIYLNRNEKEMKNKKTYSSESEISYIFATGLRSLLIGLAAMIVWNTNNIILSNILGIESVTPFSITFKYYGIIFSLIFAINGSLISIFGKEIGKENWRWINDTYTKFIKIMTIVGGGSWLFGILFFKEIIEIWSGKNSFAGIETTIILGAYCYLLSLVNLNSTIISAFNYLKGYSIICWLEAAINIVFTTIFVKKLGISGAALGTFIACLVGPVWLLPVWIIKKSKSLITYKIGYTIKHFIFILIPLVILSIVIITIINNLIIRLILSIIIFNVYIIISIKVLPEIDKIEIRNHLKKIVNIRRNNA